MEINVNVYPEITWIPKRCVKPRSGYLSQTIKVTVSEPEFMDIAFEISKYDKKAGHWNSVNVYESEGKLYMVDERISAMDEEDFTFHIRRCYGESEPYGYCVGYIDADNKIIVNDEYEITNAKFDPDSSKNITFSPYSDRVSSYCIYNGKRLKEVSEPIYVVHEYCDDVTINVDVDRDAYDRVTDSDWRHFNARQLDYALEYARKCAEDLGYDASDVKIYEQILVHLDACVKSNPLLNYARKHYEKQIEEKEKCWSNFQKASYDLDEALAYLNRIEAEEQDAY